MPVYPGNILTATAATVSANPTSTRTWQWLRNGAAIPSATTTTYTITNADISAALSSQQIETNFLGLASASSAETEAVSAYSPSLLFALNEPGVWYDPSDVANLNWRVNLATQTEALHTYTFLNSPTVTANAATAPDGTMTATQFEVGAGQTAFLVRSVGPNQIAGNNANSIYFKLVGATSGVLGVLRASRDPNYCGVNVSTLAPLTNNAAGVSNSTVAIDTLPNGWYRLRSGYTNDTSEEGRIQFSASTAGTKILLWGVQVEQGSVSATDYQPITTVDAEVLARFPNATLYQDNLGVSPVTTPGQTVGLMLDKSKGLVLGSELVTNGDFSAGSTGWTGGTVSGGQISVLLFNEATQTISLTAGRTYRVSFDINASAGMGRVTVGATLIDLLSVSRVGAVYYIVTTNTTALKLGCISGTSVSFDNISVKELPGNHAVQATVASRPLYGIVPRGGRRNQLLWSEGFDVVSGGWTRYGVSSVIANATTGPDGTLTADKVIASATNAEHAVYQNQSASSGTLYVVAKAAEYDNLRVGDLGNAWFYASFNLTTGVVSGTGGSRFVSASAVSLGSGWWGCTVKYTASVPAIAIGGFPTGATGFAAPFFTGDGTSGVFLWRAQAETGSTATAYQRVTTQYDVTEAGVQSLSYLAFDGADDFMVTPTITPGTDKVQVFSGVRKLSDAAFGMIVEGNTAGDGKVYLGSQASGIYQFYSRGTADAYAAGVTTFPAPSSDVIAGLGDISAPFATLRVDGVTRESVSSGQGTGNYAAQPIYIGRRGGSSLSFNGQLYGLITRFGPNLASTNINATEHWLNEKTGAF